MVLIDPGFVKMSDFHGERDPITQNENLGIKVVLYIFDEKTIKSR